MLTEINKREHSTLKTRNVSKLNERYIKHASMEESSKTKNHKMSHRIISLGK